MAELVTVLSTPRSSRLPAAFAVCLAACLVADAQTPAPTKPAAAGPLPDPLAAGWRGTPVCERVHGDEALRVLRCTFAPGVGHERHFHARHFGYALAGGRMRITDARGTREVEIQAGSSFVSDGVAWHEVLNVGDTPVVYLIVEPRGVAPTSGPEPPTAR